MEKQSNTSSDTKDALHDLVDQITEENKHPLQFNDDVVGLEEW